MNLVNLNLVGDFTLLILQDLVAGFTLLYLLSDLAAGRTLLYLYLAIWPQAILYFTYT